MVNNEVVLEDQEAPIHGDVLEAILSHVPLIDLVPASHVSKSWNRAVFSSIHHLNRLEPWLMVHKQRTRPPYTTTSHAYDPSSHVWIEIQQHPSIKHISTLRSSHSNLLYTLSPSKLSFSSDPLHLTWHHADAPLVWRSDPIVAAVGHRVIVAGGTCDFEDDPLAVEIYDADSREWISCESMPAVLKDSSASTWLSVASDDRRLFVTEKQSGATHTFDPETTAWSGPYDLRPDPSVFHSVVAFSGDMLILIGLIGEMDDVGGLKLWRVNRERLELEESVGEMPIKLLERLKRESFELSSIGVCVAGNTVNVYSPSTAEEVFTCEFVDGGGCRWGSVPNAVASARNRMERVVFTCSEVGIDDVSKALRSEKRRFKGR